MGHPVDFRPLDGLTVVEVSQGIAGSYCAKLFADSGAEVVRIEDPSEEALRRWSWSGSTGRDGHPDGALYRHLQEGKRVLAADLSSTRGVGQLAEVCRGADLVVREGRLGRHQAVDEAVRDRSNRREALSIVSITPFGTTGPLGATEANEFLLQARMGAIFTHGLPERTPIAVGGRLGEWATGVFAAAGALAACLQAERTGRGAELDVSMLECLSLTLVTYPTVAASFPGGYKSRGVGMMIPAVEPCADGYVGLFTVTAEQFAAFLTMIERPDLAADPELATYEGRFPRMAELVEATHSWTMARRAEEVIEQAVLFRVPAAPIGNGRTLPEMAQARARGIFERNPAGVLRPRTPFRWHRPEYDDPGARADSGPGRSASAGADDFLPLDGARVVDLTAFWAGPFATTFLASMGADIFKIESIQRPDPMRFNTRTPFSEPGWYEQGYLFHGANLGKKGVTLNLADPVGREVALRLVGASDVLIENFTPRVLAQFDLEFDVLRAANPDIICVRMPAFGLDGPWRDRPGFAPNVEQVTGMAWVTGYPDGPPIVPGGSCDPIAGMYAAFAVMGALRHHGRFSGAQMIELPMIEIGAALTAEQVIEWDAYGVLIERAANRDPRAAPQGVYECSGEESWLAVSVTTDDEWERLANVLGGAALESRYAVAAARHRHHDELDGLLGSWCGGREVDEAAEELARAKVPCAPVRAAYDIDHDPQTGARGFWQEIEHPVVGRHLFPTWPFRTPARTSPWHHGAAPVLGQDTEEVLTDVLGMGEEELSKLAEQGVIGRTPVGL